MANTKSSIKGIRQSERRRQINRPIRTALKTHVRKAEGLISAGDVQAAGLSVVYTASALDRAATKGKIHPNNAARRKSRLMQKMNAALRGSSTAS